MSALPDIPCLILAGGHSRRFGTPKGLAEINGTPMIEHVLARLGAQSRGPVAINAEKQSVYSALGTEIVEDVYKDCGPLGGIHAALRWANELGAEGVITAPLDTPFLPADFIVRLSSGNMPAIAVWGERIHPVCAYWPVRLLAPLDDALGAGLRKVRDWGRQCAARQVDFRSSEGSESDPFANVNTQEDLDRLLER